MRAVAVALLLASCGTIATQPAVDASSADASTDAGSDTVACHVVDASNCNTGPTIIVCSPDSGVNTICLGDAGDSCGYGDAGCTYLCNPNEYAAWCGSPQQSASPPSSACRAISGLPNGAAQYCCPCD